MAHHINVIHLLSEIKENLSNYNAILLCYSKALVLITFSTINLQLEIQFATKKYNTNIAKILMHKLISFIILGFIILS